MVGIAILYDIPQHPPKKKRQGVPVLDTCRLTVISMLKSKELALCHSGKVTASRMYTMVLMEQHIDIRATTCEVEAQLAGAETELARS